ncbi:MAG: DUF5658 family protein [Patescibacteria group bacterium]
MGHGVLKLLFFLVVLNINDVVMTNFFISDLDGTEDNGLVSLVLNQFGFVGVVVLKMIPLLILFTCYAIFARQKKSFPRYMVALVSLAIVIYGILAAYHLTWVFRIYF